MPDERDTLHINIIILTIVRQTEPYTLSELLIREAGGRDTPITESGTAVETACRGLWARDFAVADVRPWTGAVLASMAEYLFDRGESLWGIVVQGGQIVLRSSVSWPG